MRVGDTPPDPSRGMLSPGRPTLRDFEERATDDAELCGPREYLVLPPDFQDLQRAETYAFTDTLSSLIGENLLVDPASRSSICRIAAPSLRPLRKKKLGTSTFRRSIG